MAGLPCLITVISRPPAHARALDGVTAQNLVMAPRILRKSRALARAPQNASQDAERK
jgi:hypothetical protein